MMDRSREYIRMCRAGTEIQRRWRQRYGDFFVDAGGRVACWLDREPGGDEVRSGYRIQREDDIVRIVHCVWLPRLDQLMELAQVKGRRFDRTALDFHNWTRLPYSPGDDGPGAVFATLEQLWLAFVMVRRHGRRWQGGTWQAIGSERGR